MSLFWELPAPPPKKNNNKKTKNLRVQSRDKLHGLCQTQHKKEELGWTWLTKQLVEETGQISFK